ncbi:helix-turn-helix domain-containing protein [Streptomyces sp. N50]|uniref:nSTAND1 domain-containing NTPase n=1 Tax=Streptomyces sp. N50 TaxID=3081765 RepID=UPI0029623E95|nr:helix-turn-helix domain-containing protein [Streptomyces sp. N50]WOX11108.1 helix-turn-helix domain-containing protein [Streptomyces sp. N50]
MGRPERPVDPGAGAVQGLAHALRELRRAAGGPSYRTMAKAAGFSATTLSQAAAGERLPTLAVVEGYVRACDGDPAEWGPRWKEAEAEANRAAEATDPDDNSPAPPYRGLARFEPADRHLFFGRDRVIADLHALVRDHRFAVLFGPSGSGKSSLLRAGLIARLQEEIAAGTCPARLRILTPGPTPATTYAHLLTPAPAEPESWVVVDQFEEIFTLCHDPAERSRFIDLLLAARDEDTRLRVLVSVRADFYARCAEHRGLADALHRAALLLGPMTAEELREAVVGPAQATGCLVERTLTARLLEETLDEPGGLPMLSHALAETWRRRKGRLLTLSGYEAAGGVRGAIAATAEQIYGTLSPTESTTARHLLLRMIVPGQGTPDTRRPLTRAELSDWPNPAIPAVLERLTRARLLTADETGVHLAHEALITCWPRLHNWIEQDRERLRHHRMLTEATRTWLDHDQDPGTLYRGTRLSRAEELFTPLGGNSFRGAGNCATSPHEPAPDTQPIPPTPLTTPEHAFLTAALAARETEHRTATRTSRRHRLLTASLSVVLAIAALTTLAVCHELDENQRQHTQSAARRIADVADALRTTDPRTALQLGVAAWQMDQLPETRRALLGSLAQAETDTFTDPAPGADTHRVLTDNGHTLLSASGDTWHTWNVTTHHATASGRIPNGTVTDADAHILEVTEADGTLRLWNTLTRHWTGTPALHDIGATHVTPDGHTLLTTEGDHIRLRSTADGHITFEARAPDASLTTVSPDGRTVAACSAGTVHVWNTVNSRPLPGTWQQTPTLCDTDAPLLTLTGNHLAAANATGLRIWSTTTGRRTADLHDTGVQYASFSPDGTFMATADASELRVWRLTAPATPVFRHDLDNQHLYGGLVWDRDGHNLRYLESGTVHTLDLGASVTPAWRPTPLTGIRFSPDGTTYATTRRTGGHYLFRLYDTATGRLRHTFPPAPVPVSTDPARPTEPAGTLPLMAFSPDGTRFAYGVSAPGREAVAQPFGVWDVPRGRSLATLNLPGDTVLTLTLGPSTGHDLYAVRSSAVAQLTDEAWDFTRHRRTTALTGVTGSHLAVRPDGGLLVGEGRVAALPSGRSAGQDLVQGDEIGALAFTANGSVLAAGDQSGRVDLWDGRLRHREGVLRNVFPTPAGTTPTGTTPEGVSAVAFSPDGRTLAVGGDGGSLQLWDVATQQPLSSAPLTTPGEAITSLAFSPDGTTVYAGSAHVPLQRYVVDPARALARICARTGNAELTRARWRTYVPDAPYRRIC